MKAKENQILKITEARVDSIVIIKKAPNLVTIKGPVIILKLIKRKENIISYPLTLVR